MKLKHIGVAVVAMAALAFLMPVIPVHTQQVQGRIVVATGMQGPASSTNGDVVAFSGTAGNATQDLANCNMTSTVLQCVSAGVIRLSTDTGLSRDSAGVWDVGNGSQGDKSGTVKAAAGTFTGFLTAANTQRLTADASPIAATTPGTAVFTWPALPINANYSFHCEILYNQQTSNAGIGLAVQGATNAPTRLDSWGNIFTSNAGVAAEGSALNITTTTATSVVSGTPSAITTVFQATINGTIQVGALSPTLTVLMFTAAGADTVTPKAGSFCTVTP